jgi:hypothetical protein
MWKKGDILHLSPLRSDGAPIRVDICYNFFAARREVLRKKVRWHNDLKMCEHQAFFLDAKAAGVRVGYLPTVEINHMPASSKNYGGYRNVRSTQFYERFLELYGLSEIRGSLSA